MKLGEFLTTLAKKTGSESSPELIALLSNSELANRDIADNFANALDSGLMSLAGAKNNPELLKHFKAITLKNVDDKFSILAEKYGIEDEIAVERNSYKKFDILEAKLAEKIAALEAKQIATGDKNKETEYIKQIEKLQKDLRTLTSDKEKSIKDLETKHSENLKDFQISSAFQGLKYANSSLPEEINTLTARTLVMRELEKQGGIVSLENGVLKLKQATLPDMDFMDSGHKPVEFSDFIKTTLANNKMLEVQGGQGGKPTQPQAPQTVPAAGGTQIDITNVTTAINESLGDLNT